MDYLNKLLVLYGTETGNAQKLSELIWYDARCRRITSEIFSIDDFDIKAIYFLIKKLFFSLKKFIVNM